VWTSWQTGERLRHTGDFYKLTLMTPFFNPGPSPHPAIPIFIAGVNHQLSRLAGEACQGFAVHPFHTAPYLREAILPWIADRLAARGGWAEMGALISDEMLGAFAVEGATLADAARQARERYTGLLDRIGFYRAFTPGEQDADWQAAVAVFHGEQNSLSPAGRG